MKNLLKNFIKPDKKSKNLNLNYTPITPRQQIVSAAKTIITNPEVRKQFTDDQKKRISNVGGVMKNVATNKSIYAGKTEITKPGTRALLVASTIPLATIGAGGSVLGSAAGGATAGVAIGTASMKNPFHVNPQPTKTVYPQQMTSPNYQDKIQQKSVKQKTMVISENQRPKNSLFR